MTFDTSWNDDPSRVEVHVVKHYFPAVVFAVIGVTAALAPLAVAQNAVTRTGSTGGSVSGYVLVNGLRIYYESIGEGEPLVLLHGAFSNIHTDFDKVLPLLKGRRLIGVEQQGHGHTADIERPLRVNLMTDDTAQLLRELGIRRADLFGYSMGSGIALQMALRYPDLVRKVILMGGVAYSAEGLYPEVIGMKTMTVEALIKGLHGTPWQTAYARIAPNPADWPKLVAKKIEMDNASAWPSRADIERIKAPSLVIVGDADISKPEHAAEFFRLLGGGVPGDLYGLPRARLAILPGTTHVTIVNRAEWIASMVLEFLDAPEPKSSIR
jgi:pimeloyl-ACP methyl ester carboxylesterase